MPVKRPGVNWEDVPAADLLATPEQLAASYQPMPFKDDPWLEKYRRMGQRIEIELNGRDADLWLGPHLESKEEP